MNILDKYVIRGRRTASRIWDDTAVIVLFPIGYTDRVERIFELTKTGTYIWKLLEKKPKVREIIDCIVKNTRFDWDRVEKEVVAYISKLRANKIVDLLDKLAK